MLSQDAIQEELKRGAIFVDNSDNQIGTNYIDVTLGDTIKVYDAPALNVTSSTPTKEIAIPPEGLFLMPGRLYIGRTFEFTKTYGFVPLLANREDLAALGMNIHITAGFGDNGFEGTWTLEIQCACPVQIFPNMLVGCLYYNPLIGEGETLYRGKYFRQIDPTASRLSEEYGEGRVRSKNVNK